MKPLPLIEPDMQISRIRLTDTRRHRPTQGVDERDRSQGAKP